jgi:hypothetical protein
MKEATTLLVLGVYIDVHYYISTVILQLLATVWSIFLPV